jgi:hypothetical protein
VPFHLPGPERQHRLARSSAWIWVFSIDREDDRSLWWRGVQPDDIGHLGHERGSRLNQAHCHVSHQRPASECVDGRVRQDLVGGLGPDEWWQRSLQPSMTVRMAATSFGTLEKVPRRMAWRVIPKNTSTRSSHEPEVGVKWSVTRV